MRHIGVSETSSTITNLEQEHIQPNAVDLTIDRAWEFTPGSFFMLDNDSKQHLRKSELIPGWWKNEDNMNLNLQLTDGYFCFFAGCSYEIQYGHDIKIGEGEAGFCISRSTLIRNGLYIVSGLYDSGYEGAMGGLLVNNSGINAYIKRGSRVAQFLLFDADAIHMYDGDYGHGKSHDIRYKQE